MRRARSAASNLLVPPGNSTLGGGMSGREKTGVELLLSEPEIRAWLEDERPDDEDARGETEDER